MKRIEHTILVGTVVRWFDTGARMAEERYENGLLVEVTTWTRSGQVLQHLKADQIRAFHGTYSLLDPHKPAETE